MPLIFDGITAKAERVCQLVASVDGARNGASDSGVGRDRDDDDDGRSNEIAIIAGLDDAGLLELSQASAELVRAAETIVALAAGEIERRSRRELGYNGLAQRSGHRTAGDLVRSINKSSMGDATRLVRVGRSLIEAGSARPTHPIRMPHLLPTTPPTRLRGWPPSRRRCWTGGCLRPRPTASVAGWESLPQESTRRHSHVRPSAWSPTVRTRMPTACSCWRDRRETTSMRPG